MIAEGASVEEATDSLLASGLGDGLPVVPPTEVRRPRMPGVRTTTGTRPVVVVHGPAAAAGGARKSPGVARQAVGRAECRVISTSRTRVITSKQAFAA